MRLFDDIGLNPADDQSSAIWPATLREIEARGLTVANLSQGKISEGATAVVFKAREDRSGHIVAIKVYRDPTSVETIDAQQIPINNYFLNECKSLADLQECAAVPRYHYGVNNDNSITQGTIQPFVVMEFVDGMTADKIGKGLTNAADRTDRLSELFRQAMLALQSFHDAGKIHRDISARNTMLQGDRFRLVDCARAKAIDEVHTGTHTVGGGHTPGYASEELIGERKTAAEDVSELCTVVYEWFTDRNKSESNQTAKWYRSLVSAGVDSGLAKIIVKAMTPRNPQRTFDPNVFHSASGVIAALDRWESSRRFRKRLIRNAFGLTAIAAVMLVLGYFAWDKILQSAYTSEMRRLSDQKEVLSDAPRDARADARVQQRINAAQELEQQAEAANRQGNSGEASSLLAQAVDQITDASRVADNLARLKPLIEPLRKILLENDQWNRDCAAINTRLTELAKQYQEIQRQVESGDPDKAWTSIAAIQPKLVHLIDDNQKSYEIADLLDQMKVQSVVLDTQLEEQAASAFEQVQDDRQRAAEYYANGQWPEARTELLGAIAFLEMHETPAQKKKRMASNAEYIQEKLEENRLLQQEVKDMEDKIARSDTAYKGLIEQLRSDRVADQGTIANLTNQLKSASSTLATKLEELSVAETQRDQLTKWKHDKEMLIAELEERLKQALDQLGNRQIAPLVVNVTNSIHRPRDVTLTVKQGGRETIHTPPYSYGYRLEVENAPFELVLNAENQRATKQVIPRNNEPIQIYLTNPNGKLGIVAR